MERREVVRNLLVMAAADGSLTEREIQLLSDRCAEWGISDSEFSHIIEHALEDRHHLSIPQKRADREELLKEMIRMMAADGRLAESEKKLFAIAAVSMQFSGTEIQQLIDQTLADECADECGE